MFTCPRKAVLPSAMRRTLSNISTKWLLGWWMVQMTVLPWLASLLSVSTTVAAMKLSRPEVGSSQNMMLGLVNTSLASDSLFLCPPDIPFWP